MHPHKLRRLAILNTMFFPDYRWHFWARIWRTPWLGELAMRLTAEWSLVLEMRRGSKRLPAAHAIRAHAAMTPAMKRMVLKLYRATDPRLLAGWQDALQTLLREVPTLVLWGDRDPYIDRRFADRFAPARVRHFPDSGHWLPVEDPDAVARHLLDFFA